MIIFLKNCKSGFYEVKQGVKYKSLREFFKKLYSLGGPK